MFNKQLVEDTDHGAKTWTQKVMDHNGKLTEEPVENNADNELYILRERSEKRR